MAVIVQMLHHPSSQMMDLLLKALEDGKICVIDLSQLRGRAGLVLSGIILRRIFDRNQQEFTSAAGRTIPVIAVVEEAQSVLDDKAPAAEPYVSWVKEGRKYDLGALLITQQPGSIPNELLSQGDNWFIFHLLSAADLAAAKRANAHFSDDLLSSLLNEPIAGQGLMWSSISGSIYPVPFRVASFERKYRPLDPQRNRPAIDTYASRLRISNASDKAAAAPTPVAAAAPVAAPAASTAAAPPAQAALTGGADDLMFPEAIVEPTGGVDVLKDLRAQLIEALRADQKIMDKLTSHEGYPWGGLNAFFEQRMPKTVFDAHDEAFRMVVPALNELFGGQDRWETFPNPGTGKKWVRRKS
jgi:hypothetical protein